MTSTLSAEPAPTAVSILNRDERGRVRVPRERQEALLDEFERSGLSGIKFAALCGVKYPSFADVPPGATLDLKPWMASF